MKRSRIDFAPRGVRRTLFHAPRPAWWAGLFGLLLLLVAANATWGHWQEQRQFEEQLASARARGAVAPAPRAARPAPQVTQAQADAINAAVMQLNLPWRQLRDAVHEATPAKVALLALEPDAKKGVLRITAEARTSEDMIAYVERLKRQERFTSVSLARHEIVEQDRNRPLRFQLDAQWRRGP